MTDESRTEPTIHWLLPVSPDESFIGRSPPVGEDPTADYLAAVGEAAECAGFDGLLVPSAYQNYLEAFAAATTLLARTGRIQALIAIRPNQYHPAQAAKMLHSLQRLYPGRVAANVTSGAWNEDAWIGNYDDRETRYRRVQEWFEVLEGLWFGDIPYSYEGSIYKIDGTQLWPEMEGRIPIYFSGHSQEALRIAASFADYYLLFAAPVDELRSQLEAIRAAVGPEGRLRYGLRVNVIVRETEAEAWRAADDLISRVDPWVRQLVAERSASAHGTERARLNEMSSRESLVVGPNLWAGVGTARLGVSVSIVGSPQQVIARLLEYVGLGIDVLVLGGFPLLGEARRVGELVMPGLRASSTGRPPSSH